MFSSVLDIIWTFIQLIFNLVLLLIPVGAFFYLIFRSLFKKRPMAVLYMKNAPSGVFHSKVRGVSHKNSDGTSRQKIIKNHCKYAQRVFFKREPDNPVDKNAVAIFIEHRGKRMQIGYVSEDLAEEIGEHIDQKPLAAYISKVTGGEDGQRNVGVNFFVNKNEDVKV